MLISFTLIGVSLWMATHFLRRSDDIEKLFWLGVGPALGAAIYNLNGRPLRGAKMGLISAVIALLLLGILSR